MGIKTDISWCDSTLNLMAGCDGCELWNPAAGVKKCYAGVMTERYGGRKGWPESFDKPALFLHRLDDALRWPDLRGQQRPDRPWLDGRPRMVFLNDMGDSFTESLPIDWLAPLLPRLADSPHVWMLLTKRPRRMATFSRQCKMPRNVWPGTSVTSEANIGRVYNLLDARGGGLKWLSVEPMLGPIDLTNVPTGHWAYGHVDAMSGYLCGNEPDEMYDYKADPDGWVRKPPGKWRRGPHGVGLLVVGGESGPGFRPCDPAWVRPVADQCRAAGVPVFVKQGSGLRPGMQGELPDDLWALKEFPEARPAAGGGHGG